jgi:hypothetical protein
MKSALPVWLLFGQPSERFLRQKPDVRFGSVAVSLPQIAWAAALGRFC